MGAAVPKDDLPSSSAVPAADLPVDEHSRAALDKANANENYRVPFTDARIPHTGTVNQFLISTGRGMIDLWAGGKQITLGVADKVDPRGNVSSLVTGKDNSRAAEYTRQQSNELQEFSKLEK